MQPSKALQLFKLVINTKIEPVITYDWIAKINSKRKYDERFFTATYSGFYLSTINIIKTLKISRMYSWLDLSSIETSTEQNLAVFQFRVKNNPVVELYCVDVNKFMEPVFNYLLQYLPNHHPAHDKIPKFFELKTIPLHSQFVSMYASACHSMQMTINDEITSYIYSVLSSNSTFEVDKKKYDEAQFRAILLALKYSKNLPEIKFIGGTFKQLWNTVSNVISKSSEFKRIILSDCSKSDNFDEFCDAIKSSKLDSIEFEKIAFTKEMATVLINTIPESSLSDISFNDCNFSEDLSLYFFDAVNNNPEIYQRIQSFSISHDHGISKPDFLSDLFNFYFLSQISKLELSNSNIDISQAFKIICDSKLPLLSLNLSGNYCSADYLGDTIFPETLYEFHLGKIEWKGNSLSALLSNSPFKSAVDLNLSKSDLDPDSWNQLFYSLPPPQQSPMIVKFNWSYNPLPEQFLDYLLTMPCLHELAIKHCHINDISTLKKLGHVIQDLPIVKINIKKCIKQHPEFLSELKKYLIKTKKLQTLDVSDNSIGNDGISTLLEISLQSESLTSISFDNSDVTDPSRLIELFNTLKGIPRIRKVSKPRHDMETLSENKKTYPDLKAAWSRLLDTIRQRHEDDDDVEFDFSIANSSTHQSIGGSSPTNPTKQGALLNASWDIEEENNFPISQQEWANLQEQFSYSTITGINIPHPPDKNDLIMFDV